MGNKNDDVNFDEDDLETTIHVKPMVWRNRFKQRKTLKKDITKELMSLAWHPKRQWHWCMSENEKKRNKNFGLMNSSIRLLVLFQAK